jgi:hypothetical protein
LFAILGTFTNEYNLGWFGGRKSLYSTWIV